MLVEQMLSIIALPITAMVIVPVILVSGFNYAPFWGLEPKIALAIVIIGLCFIGSGLILLFSTISCFISKGEGTIAPWSSTKKLITVGAYAHVRNPMLTGAFLVLIGETIPMGSLPLSIYTTVFISINLFYIPLIEEPKLTKKFGKEYLNYKQKVPRWIPHIKKS
jgi:protein-S-isoprenylcysteine O-methyltransferase Ste14